MMLAVVVVVIFIAFSIYKGKGTVRVIAIVLAALIGATLVLNFFIKSTRFDLIHGGSSAPSSSPDRNEAIERGVYVADISLVQGTNSLADSLFPSMKTGWVERNYFRGFWYWETEIPAVVNYQFRLPSEKVDQQNIYFLNCDTLSGYSGLSFREGNYHGSFKNLPSSDTLQYWIVNTRNLKLDSANILGTLKFALINKKTPKGYSNEKK